MILAISSGIAAETRVSGENHLPSATDIMNCPTQISTQMVVALWSTSGASVHSNTDVPVMLEVHLMMTNVVQMRQHQYQCRYLYLLNVMTSIICCCVCVWLFYDCPHYRFEYPGTIDCKMVYTNAAFFVSSGIINSKYFISDQIQPCWTFQQFSYVIQYKYFQR